MSQIDTIDQPWRRQNKYYSDINNHYCCPDCHFLNKYPVSETEGDTKFFFFSCNKTKGQITILDSITTIEMKKNHLSESFSVQRSEECYKQLRADGLPKCLRDNTKRCSKSICPVVDCEVFTKGENTRYESI